MIAVEVFEEKMICYSVLRWCDELNVVSPIAILVVGWFGIPIVLVVAVVVVWLIGLFLCDALSPFCCNILADL
ncbi:hypothetical protein Nepgr_007800 [Nepenthes gracilis]|uniref:Transmembrane protein n=1 Tax=Nepenthes gracilis TaxID=150966 RepID=A0AAD3S7N1_NEPGR|nr:hypothetical protein Nepgr_007800 [Nepenthes gracilis]